jgi:SAM-dependent methyltransferase
MIVSGEGRGGGEMNGADPDGWSAVAADWSHLWGELALPVWRTVISVTGIGPGDHGVRVLDVGCGGGDFLAYLEAHLERLDVVLAGIDPAPGMVDLARSRLPGADLRIGSAEHLPWAANIFDVTTAFNSLQFAPDTLEALVEMNRVTVGGGRVAIANWADERHNDLDTIEAAVARSADEPVPPGGPLRDPDGLERVLAEAGLEILAAGLVEVPWYAPDDDTLVRGVLLGEDAATVAARADTVITAARPFRTPDGGYRLVNAFRYAVGRV